MSDKTTTLNNSTMIGTGVRSVEVDFVEFAHFLERTNYTEEQKHRLLEALWEIAVAFVDLGFGVHPAQSVCGKADKVLPFLTEMIGDPLEWRGNPENKNSSSEEQKEEA